MKKLNILASFVVGLAVTGCASSVSENSSLYSNHQPVIERNNFTLDINLSNEDGITSFEQKRLAEWMSALDLGYGDRVSLDFGNGFSNALAKQTVADLAANRGLLLQDHAPLTEGQIPSGSVRVVVSRSTASVPSCPNWETSSASNFDSGNHSNYGCATNSNLAAMVADPEDLVRGVDKSSSDPTNGTKAINALREKAASSGTAGNASATGGQ